jgi:hypothetical protein
VVERHVWIGAVLLLIGPVVVLWGVLSGGSAGFALVFTGLVFGVPSVIYGYRIFRGEADASFGPGTEPYVRGLELWIGERFPRLSGSGKTDDGEHS